MNINTEVLFNRNDDNGVLLFNSTVIFSKFTTMATQQIVETPIVIYTHDRLINSSNFLIRVKCFISYIFLLKNYLKKL
jgi:hypothetical protein